MKDKLFKLTQLLVLELPGENQIWDITALKKMIKSKDAREIIERCMQLLDISLEKFKGKSKTQKRTHLISCCISILPQVLEELSNSGEIKKLWEQGNKGVKKVKYTHKFDSIDLRNFKAECIQFIEEKRQEQEQKELEIQKSKETEIKRASAELREIKKIVKEIAPILGEASTLLKNVDKRSAQLESMLSSFKGGSYQRTKKNKKTNSQKKLSVEDIADWIYKKYMEIYQKTRLPEVKIHLIRKDLNIDKELFDKAIAYLEQNHRIDLLRANPSDLKEKEKKEAYLDPEENVIYFYMRWR